MEEATLTNGEVGKCGRVRSASHMNGAIVISLDSTAKVSDVAETGVLAHNTFVPVLPSLSLANMITSSNTLVIKNETLL